MSNIERKNIERKIIESVVKSLLYAGYQISVNNGIEDVVTNSRYQKGIMEAIGTTDMDFIIARSMNFISARSEGFFVGAVHLIHGNGSDVISDYTISLEHIVKRALDLSSQ